MKTERETLIETILKLSGEEFETREDMIVLAKETDSKLRNRVIIIQESILESREKKIITTVDRYKFEQIGIEEAKRVWNRKGILFVVNIYDKNDSQVETEKDFQKILKSREDVFCVDTIKN